MFNIIKKLRQNAQNRLFEKNNYNNMIGSLLKKKLIVQIDMSRDENIINNYINNISRQFAYNPDIITENREDLLNRVKKDINNSTLSAGYITICDNMIHGYYGGRQHEGLKGGKFIFDKNKLEDISQICLGTNRIVREINEKLSEMTLQFQN